MTVDPTEFRVDALLTLQRALWDVPTPTLRAVTMRTAYPIIEGRLLFESVGDEEFELASLTTTYVLADYYSQLIQDHVKFTAVAAPQPGRLVLEDGEEWVYRRREGDSWMHPVPGRSEMTTDAQTRADETAANIPLEETLRGGAPVTEWIDFGHTIGTYVSCEDGTRSPTSVGVVHWAMGRGVHVIPARPTRLADSERFWSDSSLSLQRALWDVVTTTLRGVAVRHGYPVFRASFLYEAVGEEERETVAFVAARVAADFVPPVEVEFSTVALAPGKIRSLDPGERWFYLRCEEDVLAPAPGSSSEVTLTPVQAFAVMSDFIRESSQRAEGDLTTLIDATAITDDGRPTHPSVWHHWLTSIARFKDA